MHLHNPGGGGGDPYPIVNSASWVGYGQHVRGLCLTDAQSMLVSLWGPLKLALCPEATLVLRSRGGPFPGPG
jgi:hypothetical protein